MTERLCDICGLPLPKVQRDDGTWSAGKRKRHDGECRRQRNANAARASYLPLRDVVGVNRITTENGQKMLVLVLELSCGHKTKGLDTRSRRRCAECGPGGRNAPETMQAATQ